tara:strand:- start:1228 stop:1746 length:519 start_codon:yes stop_codon:yes gene_type:complete
MAFTMNKDRINLRGSTDTPGPFSADHTSKITMANKMADGVPDGPGSQGEAMGPILKVGGDKVDDGNVKVTRDKISGQANNVEVTIPQGSNVQTIGRSAKSMNTSSPEIVMTTLNKEPKKEIRTNYSRGGQERSLQNSNYNARNVTTPKQMSKIDADEKNGKPGGINKNKGKY